MGWSSESADWGHLHVKFEQIYHELKKLGQEPIRGAQIMCMAFFVEMDCTQNVSYPSQMTGFGLGVISHLRCRHSNKSGNSFRFESNMIPDTLSSSGASVILAETESQLPAGNEPHTLEGVTDMYNVENVGLQDAQGQHCTWSRQKGETVNFDFDV